MTAAAKNRTDTERLDWLISFGRVSTWQTDFGALILTVIGNSTGLGAFRVMTPREAIDAAMDIDMTAMGWFGRRKGPHQERGCPQPPKGVQ